MIQSLKAVVILVLIILCQVAAFYPCLTENYAHRDDYVAIRFYGNHENVFQTTYAKDGRWLSAILAKPVFRYANNIETLWQVRALGIIGNLFFNFLLWAFLFRVLKLNLWSAALISTITSITFCSAVYVGWTVCYIYTWSSSLALLAGILGVVYPQSSLFRGGVQAALIFICLCIYQSTAFLFFLPWLLSLWQQEKSGDWIRPGFRAFLLFSSTAAAYFLVLVLFLKFGFENAEAVKRFGGEAGLQVDQKWKHFQELLKNSFLVFSQDSRSPYYFLQPLLLLTPIFLFLGIGRESLKDSLLKLSVFILIVVYSFAPILASDSPVAGHRVLIGSTVFILAISLLSLFKLIPCVTRTTQIPSLVLLVLLCFQVHKVHFALGNGIVFASQREFSILQEAFIKQFPERPEEINFILSPWSMKEIGNGIYSQEFGLPSSNNFINSTWMIASVMDSLYGPITELPKLNFIPFWERSKFLGEADSASLARTIDSAQLLKSGNPSAPNP